MLGRLRWGNRRGVRFFAHVCSFAGSALKMAANEHLEMPSHGALKWSAPATFSVLAASAPPSLPGAVGHPHASMLRGSLVALALSWAAAWFLTRWWRLWPAGAVELVLSAAELGRYTGAEDSAGLYLAVLGQVFDVQRGRKHYGPGGAYSFFSGKDASRAFATGDFTQTGLVDDISGLSPVEMLAIQNWLTFYNKNYVLVGKVAGRFYDEKGVPTEALKKAQVLIEDGQRLRAQEEEKKKLFPPCNSEWSSAEGSRVWCSKQSGGVSRDWRGVPRKLYEPGSRRSHCVCVRTAGPPSGQLQPSPRDDRGDLDHPNLQEYEGCHPLADWCAVKD